MEKEQLEQYLSRIEKLNEEVDELKSDIRQVYAEIRSQGFDCKAIKEIIKLRKLNVADKEEFLFNLNKYSELVK